MTESSYYARITSYYLANASNSVAWEAKITKTASLPFSCLLPHQEAKLLQAERVYGEKIADNGLKQKPFDGFILYKATSVLIAIYYVPHETEIYEIPIRAFINEKHASSRKSLTKKRASEIGKKIFFIS